MPKARDARWAPGRDLIRFQEMTIEEAADLARRTNDLASAASIERA